MDVVCFVLFCSGYKKEKRKTKKRRKKEDKKFTFGRYRALG